MSGSGKSPVLHTGTALARGLRELFRQLGERLSLRQPIDVGYIGAPGTVTRNIQDAVALARNVQAERNGKS